MRLIAFFIRTIIVLSFCCNTVLMLGYNLVKHSQSISHMNSAKMYATCIRLIWRLLEYLRSILQHSKWQF